MARPRLPTVGTLVTVLGALLGPHFQSKELQEAEVSVENYALQLDYNTDIYIFYNIQRFLTMFVELQDSPILPQ